MAQYESFVTTTKLSRGSTAHEDVDIAVGGTITAVLKGDAEAAPPTKNLTITHVLEDGKGFAWDREAASSDVRSQDILRLHDKHRRECA